MSSLLDQIQQRLGHSHDDGIEVDVVVDEQAQTVTTPVFHFSTSAATLLEVALASAIGLPVGCEDESGQDPNLFFQNLDQQGVLRFVDTDGDGIKDTRKSLIKRTREIDWIVLHSTMTRSLSVDINGPLTTAYGGFPAHYYVDRALSDIVVLPMDDDFEGEIEVGATLQLHAEPRSEVFRMVDDHFANPAGRGWVAVHAGVRKKLGVTLILTPIIANCVSARHCRES